jgi:hypothetical protein
VFSKVWSIFLLLGYNNFEILGENLFLYLLFNFSSFLNIHLVSLLQTPSIKINPTVCDDNVLLKYHTSWIFPILLI